MKEQDGSWKGNKKMRILRVYKNGWGHFGGARDRQGFDPGIGLTGADYKYVGLSAVNMVIMLWTGRNVGNVRHCEMYLRMKCGLCYRRSILS